jgi:hypothetical protein
LGTDSSVELQRSAAKNDAIKGCMAQKGYVLVQEDQAEIIRAQFAATAAQSGPQMTAPAARRTAAVKPKPTPQPGSPN